MPEQRTIEELLAAAQVSVDDRILRAVVEWYRAWTREWEKVRAADLGEDDLPAPLWCWPP